VFEGLLEVRISTLPLNGNAKQPCEAGKEVCIREIELAGVGTVDFEDAERQMAFAAPRDQDVDRALDSVIRQQLGRPKARFLLEVIGNDDLAGMECLACGGFHIDPQ
jgi:hypothetical protein